MAVTSQTNPQITGGVITRISGWAATPLTQQVDVGTLALCIVLVICIIILWTRVLRHIVMETVREIPT